MNIRFPICYYSLKCMWLRKKAYALSLFMITIIMALLLTTFTMISSLAISRNEHYSSIYGDQDIVLYGVQASIDSAIKNDPIISNHGHINNIGVCYNTRNELQTKVVIGYMDDSALDISNINILSGRFPLAINEVVVEKAALSKLNIEEDNKVVNLSIIPYKQERTGIISKIFVIVGIIENYTENQNPIVQSEDPINYFPSIFLYDEYVSEFDNLSLISIKFYDNAKAYIALEKYGSEINGYFQNNMNDSLVMFNEYNSPRTIMFNIFAIGMVLTCAVSVFGLYVMVKYLSRRSIVNMRIIGASRRQLIKLLLYQSIFLCMIGTPISILLNTFFSKLLQIYVSETFIPYFKLYFNFRIIITLSILSTLLIAIVSIIYAIKQSMGNILNSLSYLRKKRIKDNYKIKLKNPLTLWSVKSFLCNRAEMASIGAAIAIGIAILTIFSFLSKIVENDYRVNFESDYHLELYNVEYLENLRIPSNISKGMSDYEKSLLEKSEDIESLLTLKRLPMNLLIREGNNYITDDVMERNRLGSLASIIDYENEKLKYGYNRNDSLFLFDIYGYDSDTIENLNIYLKEGSINIEQLESAKEIIIITQNRKMVPFNLGDEIEFTQLIYGATSYNNLPTKIIFQTKIAGIAVVDSSAKDIVVPNEYAFVFSHESFSEVGIKANYTNIYIALKDSAKYEDIERTIDIVKEINPLIKIESARTIRENLNDVRESVNAVNAIYVAIISVFAFINLLIVIHNRYKRRRKIYALIRILGVSKKELTMVTFIENAVIAFVSWVIGYSIGIISCKMLSDGSKVWMRYLPIGGIVIMLACVIIAIMFLSFRYANKFYKENIIESIRYIG